MSDFVVCENKIMLGEVEVSESDTRTIQMIALMMGKEVEEICEILNAVFKMLSDAFGAIKRMVEYFQEIWNIAKEELCEPPKEVDTEEQESSNKDASNKSNVILNNINLNDNNLKDNNIKNVNINDFKNIETICIKRPNYDNGLSYEEKKHPSEVALDNYSDFTHEIINDGSLDDLKSKVSSRKEKLEAKEESFEKLKEKYYSIDKINKDLVEFQKEQESYLEEIKSPA